MFGTLHKHAMALSFLLAGILRKAGLLKMGEKDITEKTLEAYNDVFADIVNVLLFKGKQIVNENSLSEATVFSQYKSDGKMHEQERDVAKYWQEGKVNLAIYGLENQTDIDTTMPLRVIGYDGAMYRGQIKKDDSVSKKYCPVVTLVLYFGKKHWYKNRTLLERLKVPENIKAYLNDYKINVFEIAHLSMEQVELFKSDFRIVAEYFVQKRLNKDYKPAPDVIEHVDELLKLMSVLTRDNRFENKINELKGRSDVTMCEILDKIEARGVEKGMDVLAQLYAKLSGEGRMDDWNKAVLDSSYRDKLLKEELGIE